MAYRLRNTNLQLKFATNTTKESQSLLYQRLKNIGFEIEKHEIFTSLTAARDLIAPKKLKPYFLVDDAALSDFEGHVPIDTPTSNANAVVVGLAPTKFNHEQMNIAMNILLEGSPLYAIHKGRFYKTKDGLALGPGPFIAALEHATDKKAIVVGKPQPSFFKEAIRSFNCEPNEVAMIGDVIVILFCDSNDELNITQDVRDDIGGAQNIGMVGFLVKTGKYRPEDESKIDPLPKFVCPSVVEAVDIIISQMP